MFGLCKKTPEFQELAAIAVVCLIAGKISAIAVGRLTASKDSNVGGIPPASGTSTANW